MNAAFRCALRSVCFPCALLFAINHAAAGPFSNLALFGDSLSDIGNIAQAPLINTPGTYYWNGRFSNGPVYAESFTTGLGLPMLTRSTVTGGNDFAYGGAKTTGTSFPDNLFVKDIDDQVSQYLSSRTANGTTLYVVFAGANDLLQGQTNMSVPINSLQTSMNRLVTAGARTFLVFNLPPLGNTPRFNGSASTMTQYNNLTQQYNTALATMVNGLHASNPPVTVYQFDVSALVKSAITNPQAFGLTNVTNSAAPGLTPGASSYDTSKEVPNPNEYVFWDDIHPTTFVHAILAQRALDLFRLPGDFDHNNVVDSADYVLWRAGRTPLHIADDYNIWRAHDGQFAGAGTNFPESGTVPEPGTITICMLVLLCASSGRRWHTLLRFLRTRVKMHRGT
jgi:thermolabile hemolysin